MWMCWYVDALHVRVDVDGGWGDVDALRVCADEGNKEKEKKTCGMGMVDAGTLECGCVACAYRHI